MVEPDRMIFTSTKEIMFSRCLFVCLPVSNLRKNLQTDLHEIFREGWPINKWLNFGGDLDQVLPETKDIFNCLRHQRLVTVVL